MKKILVTEENLPQILGMVKKFFLTKNPHHFEGYHNFDCGWTEDIPYWVEIQPKDEKWRYGRLRKHGTPVKIEIVKDDYMTQFIRISYPDEDLVCPTVIVVGSVICFNRGNYLVIRDKWTMTKTENYIYNYVKRVI